MWKLRIPFNGIRVIWLQNLGICNESARAKTKGRGFFLWWLTGFTKETKTISPSNDQWFCSFTITIWESNAGEVLVSFIMWHSGKQHSKVIAQWALSKLLVIYNEFNSEINLPCLGSSLRSSRNRSTHADVRCPCAVYKLNHAVL